MTVIATLLAVWGLLFVIPAGGNNSLMDKIMDKIIDKIENWSRRQKKLPEGMVQCDLCDRVCDKTGLHFDTHFKRHRLHIMRKHWGEPLFQYKFQKLKRQRDKIAAAQQERAVHLHKMRDLEIDTNTIMQIPVGDGFVQTLEQTKAIEQAMENLNKFQPL